MSPVLSLSMYAIRIVPAQSHACMQPVHGHCQSELCSWVGFFKSQSLILYGSNLPFLLSCMLYLRTPLKRRCCISRGYPPNNTFQMSMSGYSPYSQCDIVTYNPASSVCSLNCEHSVVFLWLNIVSKYRLIHAMTNWSFAIPTGHMFK